MLGILCLLLFVILSARAAVRVGQFAVDVGDSLPSCQRGNTQACAPLRLVPVLRRADWAGTEDLGSWAIVRAPMRRRGADGSKFQTRPGTWTPRSGTLTWDDIDGLGPIRAFHRIKFNGAFALTLTLADD